MIIFNLKYRKMENEFCHDPAAMDFKCNVLHQIWTHPFDIWHSSVQSTLGSVKELISTQNSMHHGILGTHCFFLDELQRRLQHTAVSNIKWLGPKWRRKLHFKETRPWIHCPYKLVELHVLLHIFQLPIVSPWNLSYLEEESRFKWYVKQFKISNIILIILNHKRHTPNKLGGSRRGPVIVKSTSFWK